VTAIKSFISQKLLEGYASFAPGHLQDAAKILDFVELRKTLNAAQVHRT